MNKPNGPDDAVIAEAVKAVCRACCRSEHHDVRTVTVEWVSLLEGVQKTDGEKYFTRRPNVSVTFR